MIFSMKHTKKTSTKFNHKTRRFLTLAAVKTALGALPVLYLLIMCNAMLGQEQEEVPYFLEDFADGDATDGSPVTWEVIPMWGATSSAEVVRRSYTLTTEGRSVISPIEPVLIGDVSIRLLVRGLNQQPDTIMVSSHWQNEGDDSYMAGVNDHGLTLWEGNGTPTPKMIQFKFDGSFNPWGDKDVYIQFDVVGKKLSLTAWAYGTKKPSRPQISATASTILPPGRVGITVADATIAVRSFNAIRIGNSLPPTLSWERVERGVLRFTIPSGYLLQSSQTMGALQWIDHQGAGTIEVNLSEPAKFFRLRTQ